MADFVTHNNGSTGSTDDKKYEAEQIEQQEVSAPTVYVAMPKIAQKGVDESSLEVTELKFLNPSDTSITLTQNAILHSPSIYTPTLDPFVAGSYLVTNGTFGPAPMVYINMPSIHALHPSSTASVVETLPINNIDQLTEYATQVIANEYVTTALTGKTTLHEGKLPTTTVNYNSSFTYKGLNGLAGFNITNVKINLTNTDPTTPNVQGSAYIPNPSVMTIELGNVTLSISTAKVGVVGTGYIENMTLVPGNNTLPMTAILNQTLILASTDTTTGIAVLEITGQSCVYNGVHLTYYEKALSQNVLTLSMNVLRVIADSTTT
ncbi:hypothetical protein G7Y89_g1200 [Cudoniella acicularis]|uniref:Uncharacterized protein n=1 Tax=Cudoniella acicularis TaxID=354080 RepID=A0A8H4WAI1_9HELO|nr:hypothetical protein G7Y89_g1200 [Cudoniella acicularis]